MIVIILALVVLAVVVYWVFFKDSSESFEGIFEDNITDNDIEFSQGYAIPLDTPGVKNEKIDVIDALLPSLPVHPDIATGNLPAGKMYSIPSNTHSGYVTTVKKDAWQGLKPLPPVQAIPEGLLFNRPDTSDAGEGRNYYLGGCK